MCVAVCRKHLDNAVADFDNGYVECTAAKVIY